MEPGPSQVAELIAEYLIPPACREEILGDLRERYRSGLSYFGDCLRVIPCVIYSRIRRTTDSVVALMEAAAMYTALVVAARCVDATLIVSRSGLARLAIPPVVVLAVMALADAYSDPQRRWPFKLLFAPALGFAAAALEQAMYRQWAIPTSVFLLGGGTGLLFVSMLRMAFPPIGERMQAAKVPAHWQKLELAPLRISGKMVLVPCVIFLAVVIYLFGR